MKWGQQQRMYFQNILMDWKSDPLDRAGAEGRRRSPAGNCFWGSVTLPLQTRRTPTTTVRFAPQIRKKGRVITGNYL